MTKIKIVDARMGRGKTSAASEYMLGLKGKKHFLYITPYLAEVGRICETCDFEQPDSDSSTKLTKLKAMLRKKKDIAATHSLYYLMDDKALEIANKNGYCLIIDEAVETVRKVNATAKDMEIIKTIFTTTDENGYMHWVDPGYTGKFYKYKEMADANSLYNVDGAMLLVMRPELLTSFDEVIMMTYLFEGQQQNAYLDYFGLEYQICGIDSTDGYSFTDVPDAPPPLDLKDLVQIVDDRKLNAVGDGRYALSANWFRTRSRDNEDMKRLRNNLNTFFRRRSKSKSKEQLWTCFKTDMRKVCGSDGRFANSFLQMSARATNEYRDRYCLAYLANKFVDPNIVKFFATRGVTIDADEYALSEMLQWIWRGRIRDNQPIELYIPSSRMRKLMLDWIDKTSKGDK